MPDFPQDAAQRLLASYDSQLPVNAQSLAGLTTLDDAKTVVAEIVNLRKLRGEKPLGYKIGFTNRTLWSRYGVNHPIWAPVWDTTVSQLAGREATVSLARFINPRLEPEIVIGLARTPEAATAQAVADATAWIAHGVEIVQSPFDQWQFTGAQSFAAQALHGALLIGPRLTIGKDLDGDDLPSLLSQLTLRLYEGSSESPVDQGQGHNVLDGPCHALAHLVSQLSTDERLQSGHVVTTGTITDAVELAPGQVWRSEIDGVPGLKGLTIKTGF